MRLVVQRVTEASVTVAGEVVGRIDAGLMVLVGVAGDDSESDAAAAAEKLVGLRVFEDEAGKMNRSVADAGGSVLAVSQFTLLGDCRKGRRPSFVAAARPERANEIYDAFVAAVRAAGVPCQTGVFRADMRVALVNDGPVTLLVDTRKTF